MNTNAHTTPLSEIIDQIGPGFAEKAPHNDATDTFVSENFEVLKQHKMFSAMIPAELGGGGVSYSDFCDAIRQLGTYCGPTALTLSMHSHLTAAAIFNYNNGKPTEGLLRKIAENQLVLISTGATDWLSSNGESKKTDGGYLVSGTKYFSSGCLAGDFLVTTAPYDDPDEGTVVMHFPVSLNGDGVSIDENWQAMGMRSTGSHAVILKDVFVPEESVVLKRPRGVYHPVWNIVLTLALPLIMSAYTGVAEAAAQMARRGAAKKQDDPVLPFLMGEMENALTTVQIAQRSMVDIADDFNFSPTNETANEIVKRKSIAVNAVIGTTLKALESSGGPGYIRTFNMERLVRDSLACQFHPMQEKRQHLFTGRMSLGLDPVEPLKNE